MERLRSSNIWGQLNLGSRDQVSPHTQAPTTGRYTLRTRNFWQVSSPPPLGTYNGFRGRWEFSPFDFMESLRHKHFSVYAEQGCRSPKCPLRQCCCSVGFVTQTLCVDFGHYKGESTQEWGATPTQGEQSVWNLGHLLDSFCSAPSLKPAHDNPLFEKGGKPVNPD